MSAQPAESTPRNLRARLLELLIERSELETDPSLRRDAERSITALRVAGILPVEGPRVEPGPSPGRAVHSRLYRI